MNEKHKMIIDKAVVLFAEKGYHATSVQEIAENCGIAKGSFYNYFRSKEELLVSVFKHFYETMKGSVGELEKDQSLTGRDKFVGQVAVHIKNMMGNSSLIQMLMQEQMLHISKELDEFLFFIYQDSLEWFRRKVKELYPDLSEEYVLDCAVMMDSLFKGYMEILIRNKEAFNSEMLPIFLLNRMDSIIGSWSDADVPLLKQFPWVECKAPMEDLKGEIQMILDQLVNRQKKESKGSSKFSEAFKAIQNEFGKEHPSGVMVEGLLLYLEKHVKKNFYVSRLNFLIREYLASME